MSTFNWTFDEFISHERKVINMLTDGNNKRIKKMNKDAGLSGNKKLARVKFKNKAERDAHNKAVMGYFG